MKPDADFLFDLLKTAASIIDSETSPSSSLVDIRSKVKTLSALSLTCQPLRQPCQKYIFRTMTLFSDKEELHHIQSTCATAIRWCAIQNMLATNPRLADLVENLEVRLHPEDTIEDGVVLLLQQFNSLKRFTIHTWLRSPKVHKTNPRPAWPSIDGRFFKLFKVYGNPVQPLELRILSSDDPCIRLLRSQRSDAMPTFDLTKVKAFYFAAWDHEKRMGVLSDLLENFHELETLTICYTGTFHHNTQRSGQPCSKDSILRTCFLQKQSQP
ncbi:hypothetical protein CPB84DRAFT_330181 [Gymnopilus junonius]|uniref:Uncharacterized protein n=1 Tax=Gymnopilus junonius TaxID=109634 RepID=A0A9P5NCA5_GYMJU|nr:hypothetical protein CPB84DRAFT_330181 [Gymnopilus junonius]